MRRQDYGGAVFPVDGPDKIPHGKLGHGIQTDGWFVQKQDFWIVQERGRDFTPHPLSERELPRGCFHDFSDLKKLRQAGQRFAVGMVVHTVDVPNQLEAVDDRHIPPELGTLAEYNADFPDMGCPFLPWDAPIDHALAAVRRQNAAHDFDGTAFSRPVRANVADHFPVTDGEGNVLQGVDGFILPAEQGFHSLRQSGAAPGDPKGFLNVTKFDHTPSFWPARNEKKPFGSRQMLKMGTKKPECKSIRVLVRETGLEPVRHATHAPQTCLSASSSTRAFIRFLPRLSQRRLRL